MSLHCSDICWVRVANDKMCVNYYFCAKRVNGVFKCSIVCVVYRVGARAMVVLYSVRLPLGFLAVEVDMV